jgi:hypothetical protein
MTVSATSTTAIALNAPSVKPRRQAEIKRIMDEAAKGNVPEVI